MKQIIFKGQYGWYIACKNYKDPKDRAYLNLHFAKCDEPIGQINNESGSQYSWIEIEEQQYSCYQGKIGLTIFKYHETCSPKEASEIKARNFAKENSIYFDDIKQDDLPF